MMAMKKIFLLFVACTTFVCVKAQQTSAAKVSTSTGRWYNYGGDCLFRMWDASTSGVDEYGTLLANMWFDTSSICVYPTGALVDHFLSYAALLHPWATTFNDTTIYGPGIIGVTPTNAYTIDSMEVVGLYHRNTIATVSYVDTLRVSWVEGNNISGDIAGGKIVHDSLNNVAKMANHVDILLGPADVTDTDAFYRGGSKGYIGFVHKRVALPAPFAVPAMHYTGGSVTFRSGDPSAPSISPAHGFGDTVYTGNPANPYKYGAWSPLIVYHTTTGTTTADCRPPTRQILMPAISKVNQFLVRVVGIRQDI